MKAFHSAIVLLIICFSCAEALKCKSCYRRGCSTREETCWRSNDVCATIICPAPYNKYVERCMMRSDRGYYLLMGCSVDTCQHRDLCNDGL